MFGLTRKTWMGLYASMLGDWACGTRWTSTGWPGGYHGTGLVIVARWERWKKKREKARKKAGLPPAASYEKFTKWLGYPMTFLYVAMGYAFVATGSIEQAGRIFYMAVRLPLAWIHGILL